MRLIFPAIAASAALLAGCDREAHQPPPDAPPADAVLAGLDGAGIYASRCAQCHEGAVPRAPHRSFLQMMAPERIVATLRDGVMKQYAKGLDAAQRLSVAEYLAGPLGATVADPAPLCEPEQAGFDFSQPPAAAGWGQDRENSRLIPASVAGIDAADVPRLAVQWVFAFPRANRARSHPAYAGGALYVGSQDGTVYALDARTGCVRWTNQASAEVRTGITVSGWDPVGEPDENPRIYFGDLIARVYALDAVTGELLWMRKVDEHPSATVTAQPVLFEGRIYQTVSSLEVVPAADPSYSCCTFRGSVVALDAATGAVLWKTPTIAETAQEAGITSAGTTILAPSGAPAWNSPTIDTQRRRLYFGTGENYSSPAQGSSDAIFAVNLDDGSIEWVRQATAGDAWNVACMPVILDQSNCPAENGPDVDFGAPPILVGEAGSDILVAGQKSGEVWGISPLDGAVLWRQRPGRGGVQGGVHFGMAAEGRRVFVPISDFDDDALPLSEARPGLYAMDAFTGENLWSAAADDVCNGRENCDPGISQAITAIPGIVFAGHMDGRLRAHDSADGRLVWEFDTTQRFVTLNGERSNGGSLGGAAGPLAVNGMLYVSSGYGIYNHMPGNILIAFAVTD